MNADYDVLVIGSGFGGSVAALRLAEKGYRVGVLEAGRRFGPADFPRTSWRLRRFLWAPRIGCRGIQRFTLFRHALVLSGAGVGGGSLVYANVLYEPRDADPGLGPFYEIGRRMLGSTPVPFETPADRTVRQVARQMGVADTYRATEVGVYFGGEETDPYFDGEGPLRKGCLRCGGCMIGCRHLAKNTLDLNYLWLAERQGAQIEAEREAHALRRLSDGRWEVSTRRPGLVYRRRHERFRSSHVVLAAGVLGTLRLLFRLPDAPARLGEGVRTNSEAIVGAWARRVTTDHSNGVAIGSSFDPDPRTQIQPVRYPKGSNLLGLLGTVLVDGGGRLPRPLRFAATALRHPNDFVSSLSVRRWSERSIILLVMQAHESSLRLRPGRLGRLRSYPDGPPPPTYLPVANDAARLTAELIGGRPGSSLSEVLLDAPVTAHILGGVSVGDSPETGVVDRYHRVFGHPGLHVVDGSTVGANLGVNPALTIVAQAERAMSFWPPKGEPDSRPAI
jgi:cholesterol oxidase